jgi:hypothetical protein
MTGIDLSAFDQQLSILLSSKGNNWQLHGSRMRLCWRQPVDRR